MDLKCCRFNNLIRLKKSRREEQPSSRKNIHNRTYLRIYKTKYHPDVKI